VVQPNPYNRAFNFSNYQAANPSDPLPGGSLDEELSRVKAVIDQIRTSIRYLQRDDFAIANQTVGFDQLKTEVSIGINPPSIWAPETNYIIRDSVFHNSNFYIATVSHISTVFATDLAAGKWLLIASFESATSASVVTYDPTAAGLTSTNVQAALNEIDAKADTALTAIADLDATQIPFNPVGMLNADATNIDGTLRDLDAAITASTLPAGIVTSFAGATAPTGWLLCFGQAVSRTTYARLFTAIGVTHGIGDGTTTFNLPDGRGRTPAGKDDMGGVSANRLTAQPGGLNGDTLGATGGAETHTLTAAQLASHTHGVTDPGHSHQYGRPTSSIDNDRGTSGSLWSIDNSETVNTGTATTGITIQSAGSDGAHNNVQPTIIFNTIIKT